MTHLHTFLFLLLFVLSGCGAKDSKKQAYEFIKQCPNGSDFSATVEFTYSGLSRSSFTCNHEMSGDIKRELLSE